jgi:hypothetical protein
VLDRDWVQDLDEELTWLIGETNLGLTLVGVDHGELQGRLRGERYLTLLERLVSATRSPRTGDSGPVPTADIVSALLDSSLARLLKQANRLRSGAPLEAWRSVSEALAELTDVCQVAAHVLPAEAHRVRKRLVAPAELLTAVLDHWSRGEEAKEKAAEASPQEAFALGRHYEQQRGELKAAEEAFFHRWAKTAKKLHR